MFETSGTAILLDLGQFGASDSGQGIGRSVCARSDNSALTAFNMEASVFERRPVNV